MNTSEKDRLESVQDSVAHTTNEGKGAAAAAPLAHRGEAKASAGPPLTAAQQSRRRREHEKAVLEELAPRATGRCVLPESCPRGLVRPRGRNLTLPPCLTVAWSYQGGYSGEAQGEGGADTRGGQRPGVGHGRAQCVGGNADGLLGLRVPAAVRAATNTALWPMRYPHTECHYSRRRSKARRGARQQRRNEQLASKAAEARSREDERVAALKQSLGLQPGQQIKIPPRR